MNQYLRKAIEDVLLDAHACSVDTHGFLQQMDSSHIAVLAIEFDKECKKHFKPRLRVPGPASHADHASPVL